MQDLATIPVVDVRDGGPARHAELHRGTALALRAACLSIIPAPARALVPVVDAISRRWLDCSATPYQDEIARIAESVGIAGVYMINASYEWGCTTRASLDPQSGRPRIRRTLDWPFPGLGRHVHVARQAGPAGDYWNVTWPGAVGVLTALAPGRFAAALNQAPLRRRTRPDWLRPLDYGRNAWTTWREVRHMPASHLLRHVFETATDVETARRMLAEVPVARPVLFTLAGTAADRICLIERTETEARIHDGPVTVANDWQAADPFWEPRGCVRDLRTDNRERCAALAASDAADGFSWVLPPVLNAFTHLAVEMEPASGRLEVQGFEPDAAGESVPATRPLAVVAEPA